MDLWTPQVSEQSLHPSFRYMLEPKQVHTQRVLDDWAEGFADRDNKFVKEFQTTYNSSFWELYLFACMKQLGMTVDFSHSSPDFVVSDSGCEYCIEATISSHSVDSVPEWSVRGVRQLLEIPRSKIVDYSTIRLANSITSKHKHYLSHYKNLKQVKDKPFVIAVTPFDQPRFYMQSDQALRRVLYAQDLPKYKIGRFTGRRIYLGNNSFPTIQKNETVEIPLGLFMSDQLKEISAVVFSNTATFSKVRALSSDPGMFRFLVTRYNKHGDQPYEGIINKDEYFESVLDGLMVFHNPFAEFPLPPQAFNHPDISHYFMDPRTGYGQQFVRDGALLRRMVFGIQPQGE